MKKDQEKKILTHEQMQTVHGGGEMKVDDAFGVAQSSHTENQYGLGSTRPTTT